jgi:hypothetical protein
MVESLWQHVADRHWTTQKVGKNVFADFGSVVAGGFEC